MTTKDEALAKALEALEVACARYGDVGNRHTDWGKWDAAITACREALAQPAGEQLSQAFDKAVEVFGADRLASSLRSDAQPSEWVGLSDEERLTLWAGDNPRPTLGKNKVLEFARAIEAKLREKNAGQPAAGECGNTSCAPGYCYCAEDKAGGDEPVAIVVHAPTAAGFPDGETFKVLWLSSPSSFPHGTKLYPRPQPQGEK